MPDWSQLPDDTLLLIFKKLRNLSDSVKFRWVCRSWRSCTLRKGNRLVGLFPGILVSISDRDRSPKHRFLPFSHANLYAEYPHMQDRLPLLSLPAEIFAPMWKHDAFVIGSNEGWLVVVESYSIYLTNPVTGAKVLLPSIESMPGWSERPFEDERRFFGSIESWKAVLSGSPNSCNEASPCCVMILFRMWRKFPFCKIGDTAWNCVDIPHNDVDGETEHIVWLSDAIHCRGLFYIVVKDREDGKLYAFDSRCSVPVLSEIVSSWPRKLQDWTKGDYHLAELEGQLLLIFRGMFRFNYWENHRAVMETSNFEVCKLDVQHNNWVVTKSLGQYALFVGRHQSFYMSELDVKGIKANHIYYLHPQGYLHQQGCPELEIFCLENSRIEPFGFHLLHRRRRSFWFTPVMWDPKEKDPERRPYVKPRIAPEEPAVMPMQPRTAISNKFCALIDIDDDQSDDNNRDDSLALSVTIAEIETENRLNEEINDLSLNAAVRVDRQEVGDSSSGEGPASMENQTTITEAKEFHRDSNFELKKRLENTGYEVIHKHRVTPAVDDQSNGTEDLQPAISKKKNNKKSKKNKRK